jgi:putative acetyltransferase
MISKLEIRESHPSDVTGIEQLYVDAFPDEDLLPLVRELQDFGQGVVSLVGIREKEIVGHISFTFCHVEGEKNKVALLGPLSVTPPLHKQGIGSALIQMAFKRLENSKIGYVFVLGDPAYYSRFGFKAEDKVVTPYPLPTEWKAGWQSIRLCDAEAPHDGKLSVPEPWRKIALWTP